MIWHKNLATLRNKKLWIKACFFNILKLVKELVNIKRNAVSDNAGCVFTANAARHKMERKSAVFVNNSVARIGSALKANNYICLLCKHICYFAFSLVAPIGAYYCSNHNQHISYF